MNKLSAWHGCLTLLVAIVVCLGCGGGSTATPNDLPEPTVRFFNVMMGASGVDFYLNDEIEVNNLGYLGSTPSFKSIRFITEEDGAYDVSVNEAGTANELERDYNFFQRDTDTIVIAYGKADAGAEPDKRALQMISAVSRKPASGQARLYIFNAMLREDGVENSPIDIQTYDPNDPTSQQNPQFQKKNIAYGTFSSDGNVLDIEPGTKTLQVRQSDSDAIEIYTQREFVLERGKLYLAIVSGQVGSADPAFAPTLTLIPIEVRL